MNYELKVMKRAFLIIISLMPMVWIGCKEEGRVDHINDSAPAPAQVTDVTMRSTPGGVILKYTLPDDQNLRYVKAEYEIRPGVVYDTKASSYMDSLMLEGFGDTRAYDVKLFSVGKNEKASEPLIVRVNPMTAPVHLVSKQLKEAFGGVSVTIQNPERASLAIVLMADTAHLGYQRLLYTFYTSAERMTFPYRGLESVQGEYSVYLRDRWGNLSDTLSSILTPRYEELISKNTWSMVHLDNDIDINMNNSNILWDDIDGSYDWTNNVRSSRGVLPVWFTFDLGMEILMSRGKLWMMNGHELVVGEAVKRFEVWGSLNPSQDGNWDDWIRLAETAVPDASTMDSPYSWLRGGIDFEVEDTESLLTD